MDLGLRICTGLILVVIKSIRYLKFGTLFCTKTLRVPPIENQILKESATKLAAKIRGKQISSFNLVSAYIERIKEVNPIINAVVQDRFEEALKEAKDVDEYLSKDFNEAQLQLNKPLFGIPVTIKENLSVKGLSSTLCSEIRLGLTAPEDGDAVGKLKEAGAIVLLVSTTPEYCICLETYSKPFGISNNPYNSKRVCGGSSGGEGALLGAGASLIGLGSDLAGSIRFPSSFNGVFGHKPTHGHISIKGHLPANEDENFLRLLALGPMARYAEDLLLLMNVLVDSPKALNLNEPVDLSSLKVFYMTDCSKNFGLMKVQSSIKSNIKLCAEHFKMKFNCDVQNFKFENMAYAMEICNATTAMVKFSSAIEDAPTKHSAFGQLVLSMFNASKFSSYTMVHQLVDKVSKMTPRRRVKKYIDKLDLLKDQLCTELGSNGVFLFPVFPSTALRHKEYLLGYTGVCYAFIVNILGLPSTTVPIGFDSDGLPIGIQVIANVNEDRLCLAVAREVEVAFGGWKSP